jgi:hypothetical protein
MRLGLVAIALGFAVAGCTTSNTGDTGSAFTGLWKCTANDVLAFTEPPGSQDENISETGTMTITSAGDGSLTAVTSPTDAGTTCGLKYTASGNDATLMSGQTCAARGLTFTYQSGSASVASGALTATLEYSFEGSLVADGGAEQVAGTGTKTIHCTR